MKIAWPTPNRWFARDGAGGDGERRVLVLQGDLAVWTLWEYGRRVDERIERLSRDDRAACTCPWPRPGETFVDVVVDSPLDDIERVQASDADVDAHAPHATHIPHATPPPHVTGRPPGRLARRLLERRLRRRHPAAVVRRAPVEAYPLLATLLRPEIPADWQRRLETLQRGPVTIASLRSALGLRPVTADERDGDVLRITVGAGTERHLLLRFGCPVFTRVVATAESAPTVALEETLAHLAAHLGVVDPRRHRPTEARSRGRRACDESPPDPVDACETDETDDARLLAALALDAPARGRGALKTALLQKRRTHAQLRRLHAATALTAVLAGLTVLASAIHGIESARRRARAVSATEALSLQVDRLSDSVAERHATPLLADASLVLLERREEVRAPDADEVLAALADLLTAHPGIRLDRLDWSTPEPDGGLDDVRPGNAGGLPVRRLTPTDEVTGPAYAWLEIAGRVDAAGALSVRERQRRFESFVAALERDARVTSLGIGLSPAGAAATDGGHDVNTGADYVLQLRYGAPS